MATANSNNGSGFFGLLTVLFIGLKLAGIIHWTWLWVLSPIWISIIVGVIIVSIIVLFDR